MELSQVASLLKESQNLCVVNLEADQAAHQDVEQCSRHVKCALEFVTCTECELSRRAVRHNIQYDDEALKSEQQNVTEHCKQIERTSLQLALLRCKGHPMCPVDSAG